MQNNLMKKKIKKDESMGDLSYQVYEKVKQMIIEGELTPGEQVRQIQIANKLGVSRTPLINALNRLISENFVQYQPRRGYVIRKFGSEEMVQLHRVREACEGVAAFDACERITDEQIEELKSLFEPFFNITDWTSELIKRYLKADMKFHQSILEISGNPFIIQTLNNLGILYFTYQRGLLQSPKITIKDHLAIISCFSARNPELARNEIEKHLLKGRENIPQYF